jgi:hypothetical protein
MKQRAADQRSTSAIWHDTLRGSNPDKRFDKRKHPASVLNRKLLAGRADRKLSSLRGAEYSVTRIFQG